LFHRKSLPLHGESPFLIGQILPETNSQCRSEIGGPLNTVVLNFPGSPDIELLPKRGTAFDLKDQSGVTIEFKRDASGKIIEAAVNDNGTFTVLKKR
jgi:YD repeat-containing protein